MDLKRITCTVVGDAGVGKTCLRRRFTFGTGPEDNTIKRTPLEKIVVVDQQPVEIVVWNTAGIEILDRLRPMHYTHADAFLVCFAVDNPESYENLRSKWVPEVRRYRPDAALILVGTKADLRSRSNCLLVTTQEGEALAKEINAIYYAECSAMTSSGIESTFAAAAKAALSPVPPKKKQACTLI